MESWGYANFADGGGKGIRGYPFTSKRVHTNDCEDRRMLKPSLNDFAGQGVVCTVMDKDSDTLVWQCPFACYKKLGADLRGESAGDKVCQLNIEPEQDILDRLIVMPCSLQVRGCQQVRHPRTFPFYVGNPKLHKQPVDMRSISSSAKAAQRWCLCG